MKWYKHFSDSLDDPFIEGLMDEFGHTGYVAFFGLIEIIAKENGRKLTGKLSISPTYLRRKLRSSQAKLREVFEYCQTHGRLSFTFSEKVWKFDLPKMLELKDNYTSDLEASAKKPSDHKEGEVEVEKEAEEEKKRLEELAKQEKKKEEQKLLDENSEKIVSHLNKQAGTKFESDTKETQSYIKARFRDGFALDDFFTVINKKVTGWMGTEQQVYLRPSTLFSAKHFESYLNERTTFNPPTPPGIGGKPGIAGKRIADKNFREE